MEAAVDSDEEEGEEENADDLLDEDEQYADSVVAHTQLHRVIQDEGIDEWSSFLDRARSAATKSHQLHGHNFLQETIRRSGNLQAGGEGEDYTVTESDFFWEIGCRVGYEEVVAYKIMLHYANSEQPRGAPRSIVARATTPGRIYVEVHTMGEARTIASSFTELFPSVLRKVPNEECTQILGTMSSRFRDHPWARVRGKKKAWTSYKGDTGLVHTNHGKTCLVLIPRIPTSENSRKPPQKLVVREELIARYGRDKVRGGESDFLFRGQRFTKEGFLVVDMDDIDVIPRADALPTSLELDLFRLCPFLQQEILAETSAAVLHALLKCGDRVRIVAGDYLGLNGTVTEVFEHEVEVYIPGQDVNERVARSAVRAAFRVGDEVRVVEGRESGLVGWVIDIVHDGVCICDVKSEIEVKVKFAQVQFHCAPHIAAIPRARKPATNHLGPKDPNAIYIGKHVIVVGAHTYKGYRGLIKGTSPEGSAWVELEACQQRVEQLLLSDLAIQPRHGHPYCLNTDVNNAPVSISLGFPQPLPDVPSTPMASPATSATSPAWDPSSRTPATVMLSPAWDPSARTPHRPDHWLEDPCLAGVRVKLRAHGDGQSDKLMEFLGVMGDSARVRDGSAMKLIDLESVESVPPTEKDNLVTVLTGEMKGKILKVRELSGNKCVVRIPGKKLRKNEQDPSFPISAVIQVFPAYR